MTKNLLSLITGRVVAKVMILHVSVILLRGGGLRAGRTPPRPGRPPWTRQTPLDQADPPRTRQTHPLPPWDQADPLDQADPPGPGRPPPPPGSRLQNTVYEQPVRILLECILVDKYLFSLVLKINLTNTLKIYFGIFNL